MVGLGISCSRRDTSILLRRPYAFSSRPVSATPRPSAIALPSPPVQKPRPAPVSTTTPTAASAARRGSASSSASSIGPDIALSRSGRLRVSTATPSFTFSSRSLVMIASADVPVRYPTPPPAACGTVWHPRCQRADIADPVAGSNPAILLPPRVAPYLPKTRERLQEGTYDDGSFQSDGVAPAALADRPRFGGRNHPLCRFRAAARDRAVVRRTPRGRAGVRRSALRPSGRADPRLLDAVPGAVLALRLARADDLRDRDARRLRAAGGALVQPAGLVRHGLRPRRRRDCGVGAERALAAALDLVPRPAGAGLEDRPGLTRRRGGRLVALAA